MSEAICDLVAERVALGEPVGELPSTSRRVRAAGARWRCRRRIATAHADIDPGLGFSARMTQGAQQRIVVRRRRRVVGGIAATALASALGVVVVVRPSGDRLRFDNLDHTAQTAPKHDPAPDPKPSKPSDDELGALVRLADVDHASHYGADWGHIEEPLAPYRTLIKGVKP